MTITELTKLFFMLSAFGSCGAIVVLCIKGIVDIWMDVRVFNLTMEMAICSTNPTFIFQPGKDDDPHPAH